MEHDYLRAWAHCRARFITHSEWEACWTHKLWPLHIASPTNHHIEIGFGQRHCDGFCVIGGIQRQVCIFDFISLRKAISVPILLSVSIFLISVTKLWDMIIRLCMCKGQTRQANARESKSGRMSANQFDFSAPMTVKWERKCYIGDEIY